MSDSHPERESPRGAGRWGGLAIVCLAVTVIVMDGSIVNVALPTLSRELRGVTNSQLQWIVDAYILTFASLLLTAGSFADRFGRRRVLAAGLVVFGVMSTGAALATDAGSLIAWRALMGIGAAMIFPSTLAIVTDAFPEARLRRIGVACWASSSGFGVAIGPVAGGWLLEHHAWGSIFLINIPVLAVCLVGLRLLVRESRDPSPQRFDPTGAMLAVGWIVSLVWMLIEGPVRGWASTPVLVAAGVTAVLLPAFVGHELRCAAPMLDVRLFADRRFLGGCAAIASAFFGLFGFVFMVTQYFQFVHGYNALAAGLRTLPFAGFILLGSILAARWGGIRGVRVLSGVGLLLMAGGFGWVSVDDAETAYRVLVWQMGLLGVGLGLVNTAATSAIMDALPTSRAGLGSSVNDTTREIGGMLGVAAMGSLFNSVYRGGIDRIFGRTPLPAEAADLLRESVGAAGVVTERVTAAAGPVAGAAVGSGVREAFLDAFHASVWLACGMTLCGAALVSLVIGTRVRASQHASPVAESGRALAAATGVRTG